MCQFYDCFDITFVWHFFECVHTLIINWYEKLLSEYFIAMNKKTWMEHLNILIRLVLIGDMHHFWGVVRDYRCWGPTRWASSLFVPPQSAATCLSFILFCLYVSFCYSVNARFVPIKCRPACRVSQQIWERERVRALPSQSFLDEPHLDWEDKLNWLQQASCLAPGCVMDFSWRGMCGLDSDKCCSFLKKGFSYEALIEYKAVFGA